MRGGETCLPENHSAVRRKTENPAKPEIQKFVSLKIAPDKNFQQTCTGLIINNYPNADKSIREKVRKELYLCKKFGVENFLYEHNIFIDPAKYLQSLFGKINFLCSINPRYVGYKKSFQTIKK